MLNSNNNHNLATNLLLFESFSVQLGKVAACLPIWKNIGVCSLNLSTFGTYICQNIFIYWIHNLWKFGEDTINNTLDIYSQFVGFYAWIFPKNAMSYLYMVHFGLGFFFLEVAKIEGTYQSFRWKPIHSHDLSLNSIISSYISSGHTFSCLIVNINKTKSLTFTNKLSKWMFKYSL